MKCLFAGVMVLVALLLRPGGPALALPVLHPERFALSTHVFPAGSRIIQARVESNRQSRQDHLLHFGRSFATEGRLTGFYMAADRGVAGRMPRVETGYLVSIFPSPDLARAAFDEQRSSWRLVTDAETDRDPRVATLGDDRANALITYVAPTGQIMAELLFQRGSVFVEVFQQVNAGQPDKASVRSFFAIGQRLSDRAGRPL